MMHDSRHAGENHGEPGSTDYSLAGLTVRSEIPLPLAAAPAEVPDVTVIEGLVSLVREVNDPHVRPVVEGEEDDMRLSWRGVARMSVTHGSSIIVERELDVDAARIAPLVLGVGLGLVLHQRGRLVLHASAVALPQGAVAFVGWKGAGKSTMAGAMVRRGHSIITDDSLPLDAEAEGVPAAWPGPAPLKLWPESASALGRAPRRLQRLHPNVSKRVVSNIPQATLPVPLLAIYSLSIGPELAIHQVHGQEALIEIMRHGYAPRFLPAAGATPAHFARCGRVARAVPVFHLTRQDDLNQLDEIAAFVENHAATLSGPTR